MLHKIIHALNRKTTATHKHKQSNKSESAYIFTSQFEDAKALRKRDNIHIAYNNFNSHTHNNTIHSPYEPQLDLNNSLLFIQGLTKQFGKKIAVNNVSFSMIPGEIIGFLGPNGAGKTTCFYSIVGFITPTRGNIYLGDTNITHFPMYKRARAGITYLPQESSIFRKFTVSENIQSILETRTDLNKKDRMNTLEFLLEELGITQLRKQKAFSLSGGERRRTEIARALAGNPKFLLLDEPFAGIDPIAVYEIKQIMKKLSKQNIGVLITDHNVRDTLTVTDRAYIVYQGQIVVEGTQREIMNNEIAKKIYLGKDFII